MISQINKLRNRQKMLDFSSVTIIYKTEDSTWRGFVMPYDITFEAESKEKVEKILADMTASYTEGLKKYQDATHLSHVPLSDESDKKKWSEISNDVMNKMLNKVSSFAGENYYAKAQLPA